MLLYLKRYFITIIIIIVTTTTTSTTATTTTTTTTTTSTTTTTTINISANEEQDEKQLETFSVQTSNTNQEEIPSNILTNQSASSLTNLLTDTDDDLLVTDISASCDKDCDSPLLDLEDITVPHAFSTHSDNMGRIPFMQDGKHLATNFVQEYFDI